MGEHKKATVCLLTGNGHVQFRAAFVYYIKDHHP